MAKTMVLTPRQVKAFDEIHADRKSSETTLKIALGFHSNCVADAHKREAELWEEIIEKFGIDPYEKKYKITRIDGVNQVVEVEDKDEEN